MQTHRGGIRFTSGLNILAGIWVLFSPWLFGYSGDRAALWASVVSGLIIVGIGLARTLRPATNPGWSWASFIVGLWVVITPWVYGYTFNVPALWSDVIVGLMVSLLALLAALSGHEAVSPGSTV